jgi:hypothetical protein
MSDEDMPEAKEKGFIPTSNSKYRAEYGVHLFLNCCASYLFSFDKEETSEGKEVTFSFHQPFGLWNSSEGTKEFPRFDYDFPSILCQHDVYCECICICEESKRRQVCNNQDEIGQGWSLLPGQQGIFPASVLEKCI